MPPRGQDHEAHPDDEDPDADEQPVQQADEAGRPPRGGQDDLAAQVVRGARRGGGRGEADALPTVVKL
jgi:hypothetical protein